jgi:hypothetical protein
MLIRSATPIWFVFVKRGRCAVLITAEVHFVYRGNVTAQACTKSAFTVTPPLRFAGRARQQKTHAGQTPGTGFFIATHHPGVKVRLDFLMHKSCLIIPGPPSLSDNAGSRCAAPFPLTCHASHPPQGGSLICEACVCCTQLGSVIQ